MLLHAPHWRPPYLHLTFPRLEILHQNLLSSDVDDGIVHKDHHAAGVRVLLAGAPAIALIYPNNVQDHTGQIAWGEAGLGGEASLPRQPSLTACSASMLHWWRHEQAILGTLHGRWCRTSCTPPQPTYFRHKCTCCTA